MLDKAGQARAGIAWCSTGVDGSSVGTAFALIPVESWMRWQLVLSERVITGLLIVASS